MLLQANKPHSAGMKDALNIVRDLENRVITDTDGFQNAKQRAYWRVMIL